MVKLTVKYRAGHSYDEEWSPTALYCLYCGKQKVWIEDGLGDYYVGSSHLCLACGSGFTNPTGGPATEPEDLQRLAALRGNEGPILEATESQKCLSTNPSSPSSTAFSSA